MLLKLYLMKTRKFSIILIKYMTNCVKLRFMCIKSYRVDYKSQTLIINQNEQTYVRPRFNSSKYSTVRRS